MTRSRLSALFTSLLVLLAALASSPVAFAQTATTEPYSGTEVTTTTLLEVLGGGEERLPTTGFEAGTIAIWAVAILAAGAALLWLAYRQRARS